MYYLKIPRSRFIRMELHKIFAPNLFRGKVALITGGGSGIGKECAMQMANLGCQKIAICGRRKEILEQAKSELEKSFVRISRLIV